MLSTSLPPEAGAICVIQDDGIGDVTAETKGVDVLNDWTGESLDAQRT